LQATIGRSVVLKVLVLLRRHAVACTAVFLVMGGSAYAAVDSATSGPASKRTFYACVTRTYKTLNLVSAERTCPNGQRKIMWSGAGKAGARGPAGATGPAGVQGATGAQGTTGAQGSAGPAGAKGEAGAAGARGEAGATGATGPQGTPGTNGTNGTNGAPGSAAAASFAHFFALMPPDNAATVSPGTDVSFPQDGPTSATDITRTGPSSFNLASIGTYRVSFQVSVTEAGQLILTLNGADLAYTVVGGSTGVTQIVEETIVQSTVINSILTVRNPAGNSTALTITPLAGGTRPVSASLVIERLDG
jgi:hypothetical protein